MNNDLEEELKADADLKHKQWVCPHVFIPNGGNPLCVHCGILGSNLPGQPPSSLATTTTSNTSYLDDTLDWDDQTLWDGAGTS